MEQTSPAVLGPVEPSVRPHALTIEQVCNIGFAVLRAHNDDRLWRALTYDSGPYDLTTPNLALRELGQAFYAAGAAAKDEVLDALADEVEVSNTQRLQLEQQQDLLHRMLEAPTTQVSMTWKDAVRQALALGPNGPGELPAFGGSARPGG